MQTLNLGNLPFFCEVMKKSEKMGGKSFFCKKMMIFFAAKGFLIIFVSELNDSKVLNNYYNNQLKQGCLIMKQGR